MWIVENRMYSKNMNSLHLRLIDLVLEEGLEHKTQYSMFPDPQYMQRCMQQLVHLGVTD